MSGYDLSRLRVVVADDQQPIRILLRAGLEAFGFTDIYEADNGEMALDLCLKHSPDIVFTDWMMEPMDGLTFTRIIRSGRRGLNPDMAILLVTGRTDREHILEARDAGVTEIVAKPISLDHLYRRIITMIENPRPMIRTQNYVGPDRRKPYSQNVEGLHRRENDNRRKGK